jgi:pimeloyl-ACP methyl ester carboxylesterase
MHVFVFFRVKKYSVLLLSFLFVSGCSTINQRSIEHESAYIGQVKRFTTYLQEHDLTTTSFVVAAFAAEPADALISGLRMLRGMKQGFHEYDANPTHLTKAQAAKPPVLLLHGYKHNQSAFIPMLSYFSKRHYDGPMFTVNMPSVDDERVRHRVIDSKIRAIDALYREHGVLPRKGEPHIRGIIIGHSLGADEAVELEDRDSTPRRLVLLGALKHSKRHQPQIYLNAVPDVVLNLPSEMMDNIMPVGDVHHINTGHLGLLSHPNVLQACYDVVTGFNM